jgi:hypothetical protein
MNNDWETVELLAADKTERLGEALRDAETFQNGAHAILDWLAGVEMRARTQNSQGYTYSCS